MNAKLIPDVIRKHSLTGFIYQPCIRVETPFGTITHRAEHVWLTNRTDAELASRDWAIECYQAGYIV